MAAIWITLVIICFILFIAGLFMFFKEIEDDERSDDEKVID